MRYNGLKIHTQKCHPFSEYIFFYFMDIWGKIISLFSFLSEFYH